MKLTNKLFFKYYILRFILKVISTRFNEKMNSLVLNFHPKLKRIYLISAGYESMR